MDTSPLVTNEIEAGKNFLEKLNAFKRVAGACWLRGAENEERYLYAVIKGLTSKDFNNAYGEVFRITKGMRSYLDPFRVKLIGEDDSIARAIAEIYRKYPKQIPPSTNDRVFAGMPVADVYIYPPLKRKKISLRPRGVRRISNLSGERLTLNNRRKLDI
jgi:hypothetical protein